MNQTPQPQTKNKRKRRKKREPVHPEDCELHRDVRSAMMGFIFGFTPKLIHDKQVEYSPYCSECAWLFNNATSDALPAVMHATRLYRESPKELDTNLASFHRVYGEFYMMRCTESPFYQQSWPDDYSDADVHVALKRWNVDAIGAVGDMLCLDDECAMRLFVSKFPSPKVQEA